MFDFLSSDPAPARRDFSKSIEKDFSGCADFESRALSAGGVSLTLFYLDGCVSAAQISSEIVRPLSLLRARSEHDLLTRALEGGVWACTVRQRSSPKEAVSDIAAGYAALVFDGESTALTFEVKSVDKRGVNAPTVEKSVLGAKDAFVESVRVNTALLRRRVGKPSLKLWETMLGSETKTRVDILYIEGEAPPEQVERIKARLSLPDIPAVLAAGDVEQYLAGTPRGIFPQVIHTERPDRFVLGLARGKIGVLCDGLPIGFLLPAALPDMLRVQEDRARHAAVATALVLLRYLALFLSLALPALYVAIAMYHQEMIPYKLLQNVIDSKQSVPFSTAAETLGMLLSFELLQEAGIRLPDPVGQTVSVIGALIVGQSAVEAKVLSPIVIIVVAMAGIAGYALARRARTRRGGARALRRDGGAAAAFVAAVRHGKSRRELSFTAHGFAPRLSAARLSPAAAAKGGSEMKRFFRLSAALAALALLSGCASLLHPRQVEDLQLIQTIGFDGGIGDMTVSVSSGEASEDAVSAQLAARGASIQTAVQRLQDFSPREELFFAHIRYAAVGEDCARGGITPILDYFERGTQTQLSVPLFVVKGESAYTLVAANGGENEITAALSSLEADTKRQGSARCFTVLEIASRLNRSGAALACAIAPTAPERSVPEAEDGATLALEAGYAVFRGETLCGFLDTDAALGADLLLGFAPQASYVLPDGSGGTVTVQLHTAKASLSPVRNGGETAVRIAVRVRAGVTESSGADTADAEMLARLEDGLSRAVAAQIEAAAEASKALDADFLELWRVLPEVKDEGVLASLRTLVQTESVLERSYDIYGSAHGKEESEHG